MDTPATAGQLSVSELAELLGVPKLEINRRIRLGDIKAYKIGWFWVIDAPEVDSIRESEWYKKYTKKHAN